MTFHVVIKTMAIEINNLKLIILMIFLISPSWSQLSYPGCPDLNPEDFEKTTLLSKLEDPALDEPLRLKLDKSGRLFTIIRETGEIWMLDPALGYTKKIIGTIPVEAEWHNGLVGLALSPDFLSSGYLYTVGTDGAVRDGPHVFTVARYKVINDSLDIGSEKIIIQWTAGYHSYHLGSDLFITEDSLLFIPTGNDANFQFNNSTDERDSLNNSLRSSGNTNDLRGKVLRLKLIPLSDSHPSDSWGEGITYTIPPGNLFPVSTKKTRPEIFSMGLRNPWTINVDRNKLFIADVGPQGTSSNNIHVSGGDQLYISNAPANFGFPMFVDGYRANSIMDSTYTDSLGLYDVSMPINTSRFNTGLNTLPVPKKAAAASHHEQALNTNGWFQAGGMTLIAGPVYHYENYSGPNRFPPHFDNKWVIADFMQNKVKAVTVQGESITDITNIFSNMMIFNPIDMEFGSDGSLYVIEYGGYLSSTNNTKISKITYNGNCLPSHVISQNSKYENLKSINLITMGFSFTFPKGFSKVKVFNLEGILIHQINLKNEYQNHLPKKLNKKLLILQFLK